MRYKNPEASESQRFESTVQAAVTSFSQADEDSRFAAAVAAFAMRLRGSIYDDNISLEAIAEIAAGAAGDNPQGPLRRVRRPGANRQTTQRRVMRGGRREAGGGRREAGGGRREAGGGRL